MRSSERGRWYSCTTYDRQQFDQKYPGQPLNELLRYGKPDWSSDEWDSREWREKRDKPQMWNEEWGMRN